MALVEIIAVVTRVLQRLGNLGFILAKNNKSTIITRTRPNLLRIINSSQKSILLHQIVDAIARYCLPIQDAGKDFTQSFEGELLHKLTKSTALAGALKVTFGPPARSYQQFRMAASKVVGATLYPHSDTTWRVIARRVACSLIWGASLTSTADSSPIAAKTMTSECSQ